MTTLKAAHAPCPSVLLSTWLLGAFTTGAATWLRAEGGPETDACKLRLPPSEHTSEDDPEPPIADAAVPGERVRMPPISDMAYQLFLPSTWTAGGSATYPVVIFLHGHGDGKFTVMNSQSLPRLLSKDQSTSFDSRRCWCLEPQFENVGTMAEAGPTDPHPFIIDKVEHLHSPLADCDFADTFEAIALMPQGWLPDDPYSGWSQQKREQVVDIARDVMRKYRGDPTRVVLTGQSQGGAGAWDFAESSPGLWSAVNVICAPASMNEGMRNKLDGLDIWIAGWTGDGESGSDHDVRQLKKRRHGSVRYTRYVKAPAPPDPLYRHMANHASYDLIYRDPRLWDWAFHKRNTEGTAAWKL